MVKGGEIIIFLMVQLSFMECATYKTVLTPSGPIRGIGVQNRNTLVYQYRKIPFAKPPVGNLRLRKPVPHDKWTNVLDATSYGPSCIQDKWAMFPQLPTQEMSEDCLHLNVYTPNDASPKNRKNVLVWIHGGGYILGQSSFYDATNLVSVGDVIVVTLNYRLGYLGFLSLGDDASRGNYGLWDQQMGMRWVKNNIAAFGGNPDYITIFGESAGGFSVALQALNPNNRGLFQRVIAQSGTANSLLAMHLNEVSVARGFGIALNCINKYDVNINTTVAVECMRRKSVNEIKDAQKNLNTKMYTDITYTGVITPVIDGEMVLDHPEIILSNLSSEGSKFFRSLDVMFGNTDAEGSIFLNIIPNEMQKMHNFNTSIGIPSNIFCEFFVKDFVKQYFHNSSEVSNAICEKYRSTDEIQQSRNAVDMFTDLMMVAPAVRSLNAHSFPGLTMGRNTFQYMFTRDYDFPLSPVPNWFHGAVHAAELPYLFRPKAIGTFLPANSRADSILSDIMMMYWANFAKTGSPNGPGLPYWPRYDHIGGLFLTLDTTISVGYHVTEDRIKFWNQYLPHLTATKLNPSFGK